MIATGNWGACEWTISEAGDLLIGAGAAESVSENGKYPWDEYRERIRRIAFNGEVTGIVSLIGVFMNCSQLEEIDLRGLDTSNTVDLSWMLCGCSSLEHVDLSMLDTSRVVDMSCMFLSCRNLKTVNFGSMDTSSVMDMSKMFMYCPSLKSLDFSVQDNSSLKMADDMFFGCDGLRALVPGEKFSLGGGGRVVIGMPEISEENRGGLKTEAAGERTAAPETSKASETKEDGDTGRLSIFRLLQDAQQQQDGIYDWRTSADGVLYIDGTEFSVRYDGNGAVPVKQDAMKIPENFEEDEWPSAYTGLPCTAGTQLRAGRDLFEAPEGFVFKEWNTHCDGKGKTILPGQLFNVHSDMTLYAIWAGTPVFTKVHNIPNAEYGELLELQEPEIDPRFGEVTSLTVQISDFEDSGWSDFANDEPLPVYRSGARIRYIAENYVGSTVSEERPIRIERGHYDMSDVHWVLPEDLTFNGQVKEVHLEGLPEGVTVEYVGNSASRVGDYHASAILYYDEKNYFQPDPVHDLMWSIKKGVYQMTDLNWSYMEAFTYDGQPKSVRLEGLPEGTTPYYDGADAVNAGTYVATVGLDYDINNYDSPTPIRPCTWKILKISHDMSDVHWEGPQTFVYDGSPKKVELAGLPEGVRAEYTGNVAVNAGTYTARAAFVLDDPVNYEIPDPVEFSWEICKRDHDLSEMVWTESSMLYDGEKHSISLEGIPEGVSVLYEGDSGIEAGTYTARAEFSVEDLNNYNQIESITKKWEIRRAEINMSGTRWNYSSPYIYNGTEKSVELKNLSPLIESVKYSGERAVKTGSYLAHAEFVYDTKNYNPPQVEDCSWSILKANLKLQDLIWDYEEPFIYDGEEHGVEITNLPDNAEVVYENRTASTAGSYEARAIITPNDTENYNIPDPITMKWEIRKAVFDITGAFWDDTKVRIFDGGTKSVQMHDLPVGVHVSYEGNEAKEAGCYSAKAIFSVDDTVNFVPPEPWEIQWNITPAPIDLTGIKWDYSIPFVYDGSEKEIFLSGLPEGVSARYNGNVASECGEYTAEAVLIPPENSSFRETKILSKIWKIEKAQIDVSGARWVCPESTVYDRMLKQVHLEGLPEGLRVEYTGNEAVDAGSYRAEAVLTPHDERNFEPPKISGFSWNVSRADIDISDVEWSGCNTFVYDGTVHRVILKNLPNLLDAVYEGNAAKDAGNYIALAEFRPKDQRNYNTPRRMQCEWSIAKGELDVGSVYWASGGDDLIYDGKEHSVHLAGLPQNVKASCQGNTGVDAGQYIASAVLEPEDNKNYLPAVVEPYRWEIQKAEIDITNVMWASSGELVYDGTQKVVGLTGLADDVEVEYENNVAVDAGTYHASAVLSTKNKNYVAPEIEDCTWTIAKAVPDISGISWSYDLEFVYDGYEKSVELLDLPEEMTVIYHGNAAIEAGDYVARATLVMDDALNYEVPEISLHWRIGKRDYDMSAAVWEGAEGFVYDGTAKSVELTGLEDGLEPIYQYNVAVDAGVYTATARFLYDEDNYNPPPELSCTWEIRKAPLDVSGVKWNYDGPFKASDRTHTVFLQGDNIDQGLMGKMFSKKKEQNIPGLPVGTTVRYKDNVARAPGVYVAKAYVDIPPQPNYDVTEPICLTWEITND